MLLLVLAKLKRGSDLCTTIMIRNNVSYILRVELWYGILFWGKSLHMNNILKIQTHAVCIMAKCSGVMETCSI